MVANRNLSTFNDSVDLDAFGRLRTSNPFGLFQSKNLYTKTDDWQEEVNGVGASISFLPDEAAVSLQVGTVSGEYAIRQTGRYFSYIPGKSHQIIMTGVLGNPKTNVVRRIGYFDDNDGLFFELDGTTINVVVRTSTSGSPVDTKIAKVDWNIEQPADLDFSKTQIFLIDFQWLGTGRVRFGVDIDGKIVYLHELLNANNLDKVYMATPSLPARYEIRNTGVADSSSTLKEICVSVASEGGFAFPGRDFSASNGITTRGVTSRSPILAVKLRDSFKSKDNHINLKYVSSFIYAATNDAFIELVHLHDPSGTNGNFSGVHPDSAAEFSTDISIVSGDPIAHIINGAFIAAGGGSKGPEAIDVDEPVIGDHSVIHQNKNSDNSDMFIFYATSFTSTSNVSISTNWLEFI